MRQPHFAEDSFEGSTLATLVGLLASTGLRSGEAVRLDRGDVDLTSGVILVRKTKFRKDRLVPVHPTTRAALRRYARERDDVFPRPRARPSFSALGVAVCRRAACKPTSPRLASSRALTRASPCDRTISGTGSR